MRPAWIRYIFSLLCLVLSSPGLNAQTSLVLCAATDRGELVSSIARTGVHQQKALDSLINLPERWCFTLREKGNPGSSDHHLEIAGPVTHGKATYRGIDLSVRWWPDRILIREASRPYAPGVTLQREQTDPVGYAHSPHPGFRLTQPEALLVTLAFQPAQMAEDIRVIDHWMDHTDSLPEILREFSSVSTYPEDPVERLLMLNRCEAATRLAQDILNYLNAFALAGDTAAPLAQARAILQETARINELGRSTKLPLAEGYYRTAVKHLTRGDTASAMEALHRSVAADPMHCGALEALAGTALKRQQPVIALNAARSLSLANPSDARPALRRLLPDFVATFDRLFVAEDHPSLLEMADSLIQYYIHAGEDTVVLTSQRERSRAATVEAYQRVADKARAEGRRPLAARYQAMAEEHRRQWGLPVPAAHSARSREERGISEPPPSEAVLARDTALAMPAEIRTTGEDNLRNTHVEGEESKNSGQELLYARGLPTSAHGLQIQDAQDTNKLILLDAKLLQYVNDWISDRGVGARFRVWQGDLHAAQGIADTLAALSLLSDPQVARTASDALMMLNQEIRAARCRKGSCGSHTLLYRLRRAAAENHWTEAAGLQDSLLRLNATCEGCEGLAWPERSERERIQDAAEYLSLHEQAGTVLKLRDYVLADSLLDRADQKYAHSFRLQEVMIRQDRVGWAAARQDTAYLRHLAMDYASHGLPDPSWRSLQALNRLEVAAVCTIAAQQMLGALWASLDKASSPLTNPRTLLARRIPADPWFDTLQKAYLKRFRQG